MENLSHELSPELKEQWLEVQAVLNSGLLGKAPNLERFLSYIAERYFEGTSEQIKEYSIAVHALHRPEDFDPQTDTIVRVSAHGLRKKLEHYYRTEGAGHRLQMTLPSGKYVLQFTRLDAAEALPAVATQPDQASSSRTKKLLATSILLMLLGLIVATGWWLMHRNTSGAVPANATPANPADEHGALRLHLGGSDTYMDVAGRKWNGDRYCHGGDAFRHTGHSILGTDDPALFSEGRSGHVQCSIPVPPGRYQMLLLFADTEGGQEGAREVDYTINHSLNEAIDVVDEAGGADIATGKMYADIIPMADGAIHIDLTNDQAFLNAIEIMPAPATGGISIHQLAGPLALRDATGTLWAPDRFFLGGRRSFHSNNRPRSATTLLFAWERFGHFEYRIPVATHREYTVRFYLSEGWFGQANGGPGGAGSRVFDVYANGTTLLKNFDILANDAGGESVMTVHHVAPTSRGMLELSFVPSRNYALVNAIAIESEP